MENFSIFDLIKVALLESPPPPSSASSSIRFFLQKPNKYYDSSPGFVCARVHVRCVWAPDYIWVSHLFRLFAMDFWGNLLFVRNSVYTVDCIEISFVVELILRIDSMWIRLMSLHASLNEKNWSNYTLVVEPNRKSARERVAALELEMLVASALFPKRPNASTTATNGEQK